MNSRSAKKLLKKAKEKWGFDPLKDKVPPIVEACSTYIEECGLCEIGIFRTSGFPKEIQTIKAGFQKKKPSDLHNFSVASVASALKLFFLEFPEPMMTFELYNCFLTAMAIKKLPMAFDPLMEPSIYSIKTVINLLPIGNHAVLSRFIALLNKVANNQQSNKMTSYNLAVVFAPSLIRPRELTPFENIIQENKQCIQLVQIMIEHHYDLFLRKMSKEISVITNISGPKNSGRIPDLSSRNLAECNLSLSSSPLKSEISTPLIDSENEISNFVHSLKHGSRMLASALIEESLPEEEAIVEEDVTLVANMILEGQMSDIESYIHQKESKLSTSMASIPIQASVTSLKPLHESYVIEGINLENIYEEINNLKMKQQNEEDFNSNSNNPPPPALFATFNTSLISPGDQNREERSNGKEISTINMKNFEKNYQYEGDLDNDSKPNGYGKINYENGDVFIGHFIKGSKHGKGLMTYHDGSKFQGTYQYDKREGTGLYKMTSGNIYIGMFHDDKANGYGVYYYAKSGMYSGEWLDNLFHGRGIYLGSHTKYEGYFKHGKRHGFGSFMSLNGNSFVGEYVEGQMKKGVYTFSNGDTYEGEFVDGKFNGPGTYQLANGKIEKGIFSQGRLIHQN